MFPLKGSLIQVYIEDRVILSSILVLHNGPLAIKIKGIESIK